MKIHAEAKKPVPFNNMSKIPNKHNTRYGRNARAHLQSAIQNPKYTSSPKPPI